MSPSIPSLRAWPRVIASLVIASLPAFAAGCSSPEPTPPPAQTTKTNAPFSAPAGDMGRHVGIDHYKATALADAINVSLIDAGGASLGVLRIDFLGNIDHAPYSGGIVDFTLTAADGTAARMVINAAVDGAPSIELSSAYTIRFRVVLLVEGRALVIERLLDDKGAVRRVVYSKTNVTAAEAGSDTFINDLLLGGELAGSITALGPGAAGQDELFTWMKEGPNAPTPAIDSKASVLLLFASSDAALLASVQGALAAASGEGPTAGAQALGGGEPVASVVQASHLSPLCSGILGVTVGTAAGLCGSCLAAVTAAVGTEGLATPLLLVCIGCAAAAGCTVSELAVCVYQNNIAETQASCQARAPGWADAQPSGDQHSCVNTCNPSKCSYGCAVTSWSDGWALSNTDPTNACYGNVCLCRIKKCGGMRLVPPTTAQDYFIQGGPPSPPPPDPDPPVCCAPPRVEDEDNDCVCPATMVEDAGGACVCPPGLFGRDSDADSILDECSATCDGEVAASTQYGDRCVPAGCTGEGDPCDYCPGNESLHYSADAGHYTCSGSCPVVQTIDCGLLPGFSPGNVCCGKQDPCMGEGWSYVYAGPCP